MNGLIYLIGLIVVIMAIIPSSDCTDCEKQEMTVSERSEQAVAHGLGKGTVIAGAIAVSALAFVLDSFGLAIGLAISSASPAWRDTSFALVLLSGLYLVLVALASYGLGGYIAGRMRRRFDPSEFPGFEDGMHGLVVWGIATLLAGILATVSLPLLSRTPGVAATPNATTSVPGKASSPMNSIVYFEAAKGVPAGTLVTTMQKQRASSYHVEPQRNGPHRSRLPGQARRCRYWNGCTRCRASCR